MKKIDQNTKRRIGYAVILLFVFLFACFAWNKIFNNKTATPSKEASFDEQVRDFNQIYKKALVAIDNKQIEVAEKGVQDTFDSWRKIEKNFSNAKPKEYIDTRDWGDKLNLISEIIQKSSTLLAQDKYDESLKKLAEVRIKIKELRDENKVENISNNFLLLSDEVEKNSKIESRAEFLKNLPILKIKFTETKQLLPDNLEYQKMMQDFALVISDIENSTDTTFKKNRDLLKPAFLKIYLIFG